MKKALSMMLTVVLLLTCVLTGAFEVQAAAKVGESRAIAIVFDNSGSMYIGDNKTAWCRATYAMEVFASMLNAGDTLLIYPMHTIEVGGKQYTMDNPYKITDSSQASTIREIHTPAAGGTPFASVNSAVQGLKQTQAAKKYMIVLTDGEFDGMNEKKTADTLKSYAGEAMTVMYLGIGGSAEIPGNAQSDSFIIKQAKNSSEVLSSLTAMCNQIFGRDTLPKNRISGNSVEFDISMSKLIVFVQGENVSGVNVVGSNGPVGTKLSETSTKYGTKGSNRGKDKDSSLQGMMVTYTDCSAGTYTIDYTGKATSIEVYYEPNADLDFVFTDADGNTVDPNALYEGDYKVSFGMKDAKTGKLISSDLLGAPHYQGSYFINGQEYPITHDGHSGVVPISLKMGDTFDANLTVTYLSGYTITKDSSDFGWPEWGIKVSPRPAGEFKLEITGGDDSCLLENLENSAPYILKVYYQGKQLTGDDLKAVNITYESDNATVTPEFANDHYKLKLGYKGQDTKVGTHTIKVQAKYTPPGSNETTANSSLSYTLTSGELSMSITGGDDSYQLIDLENGTPYIAEVFYQGKKLTGDELKAVKLMWDPDASNAIVEQTFAEDHYKLTLHYKDPNVPQNTATGQCTVDINASYTPKNGSECSTSCELSYEITDSPNVLKVDLQVPDDYIVIADLEDSREMTVKFTLNGESVTKEQFASIGNVSVDCGGINYELSEPNYDDMSYTIKLLSTDGIGEGSYTVKVSAQFTDEIGRVNDAQATHKVTLSNMPLWAKWVISLLAFLILLAIILAILHIKVLPGGAHITKKESTMIFDGEDESKNTAFNAKIEKNQMVLHSKYAGTKTGLTMDVKPGKESYCRKAQVKRSAEVRSASVKKYGQATIQEATIGSIKYVLNEDTGRLERMPKNEKPFELRHGTRISYTGTMMQSGIQKPFSVNTKLNFKKK